VLICRLDGGRLFFGVVTKLEEFLHARRRLLLRLRRLYRLKLRISRPGAYWNNARSEYCPAQAHKPTLLSLRHITSAGRHLVAYSNPNASGRRQNGKVGQGLAKPCQNA
jgi:hypothetical protein